MCAEKHFITTMDQGVAKYQTTRNLKIKEYWELC
jgi:hypothetical protein